MSKRASHRDRGHCTTEKIDCSFSIVLLMRSMKRLLLLILSVFSGLSIYASSERLISEEALECFVESKLRMASEMAELNLPVTSSYMKSSMKAEAFTVNLTGTPAAHLLPELPERAARQRGQPGE